MARAIHKQWRNARGGRWTARIQWYEAGRTEQGGEDIRLGIEDSEMSFNFYPATDAQAQAIWDTFKLRCPKPAKPYEKAPEALGIVARLRAECLVSTTNESKEARDGAGN